MATSPISLVDLGLVRCSAGGAGPWVDDLDELIDLARMVRLNNWSGRIGPILHTRYGISAQDGTDLMGLTPAQVADLKQYLKEQLFYDGFGEVVQ